MVGGAGGWCSPGDRMWKWCGGCKLQWDAGPTFEQIRVVVCNTAASEALGVQKLPQDWGLPWSVLLAVCNDLVDVVDVRLACFREVDTITKRHAAHLPFCNHNQDRGNLHF